MKTATPAPAAPTTPAAPAAQPQQQEMTPAIALEIAWQAYQQSTGGLTGAQHQMVSKAFNVLDALVRRVSPLPQAVEAPATTTEPT